EVDDLDSLEQAVVENLHRQDLNPLEEAAAYQQLIEDFDLTQERLAERVGKSRSAVANTLRLFQLPPSIQKLVAEDQLSAGHARAGGGTVAGGAGGRGRGAPSRGGQGRGGGGTAGRHPAPGRAARARGAPGVAPRHPRGGEHGGPQRSGGHRLRHSRGPRAHLSGHGPRPPGGPRGLNPRSLIEGWG